MARKLTLSLILGLCLVTNARVYAEELLTAYSASELNKVNNNIEIGIEYQELAQNDFRNLGSSNYTFFIGQQFQKDSLKNWCWRFLSINVDLSNRHLQNKSEVAYIEGNRENLVGKLNHQRLYLDYYPPALLKHHVIKIEFIPSLGIGYNYWYIKDTVSNEDHGVRAITVGGNFRLKFTLFDHFFIEAPNVDIAYIAKKNNSINATVGEATLDRPKYYAVTLLTTVGYRMEF